MLSPRLAKKRTASVVPAIRLAMPTNRRASQIPVRANSIASSSTARDINRQIVLNLVRKHQPVSRADLARLSRLQRSTVSLITEELVAERLVCFGAQGNLPRGRKPTFLHLNHSQFVALGVEINPEETTLTAADLGFNFLTKEVFPTSRDPRQFIAELNRRILALEAASPQLSFAGVGIVVPGRIDPISQRVLFAPSLPWQSVDLKMSIEQVTGLTVEIENCATACALAELWSGRYPETVQNVVAVTVAEGIEIGLVLNGQIVRGAGGLAGEFGHVAVQEQGPECRCGNKGCLAVCGSNLAAVKYFQEHPVGKLRKRIAPKCFKEILQFVEQGEPRAVYALNRMAYYLGLGIAMLVTGLAPDVVLLVGEVARSWRHVGPIIDQVVAQRLPTGFQTRILPIAPESQLPLRGAIVLVLQKHFGSPRTSL